MRPSATHQARSRLCLGETLRRFRRRGEAGRELNQAYLAFELLGAQPWAERTAAELATTGVSTVPRGTPIHIRLTPQELRGALQVADGLSNQEVAARLFLSHKTIEVHLGHIYDKLGVAPARASLDSSTPRQSSNNRNARRGLQRLQHGSRPNTRSPSDTQM